MERDLNPVQRDGATRRGVLRAGAAVALTQALPAAWPGGTAAAHAADAKHCAPRPPGVRRMALALSPDGRTLWTADTGRTTISAYRTRDLSPRGHVDVGDAPLDVALSPTGLRALVTTGFYDRPGLAVVDLAAGRVASRVPVGRGAYAVGYAPDGTAYVAGGGSAGRLLRVDPRHGRFTGEVALGADPRGLAFTPHGRYALVALNGAAEVAVVDLERLAVVGRIPTAPFPYLLAVAPHGGQAYVSHNAFGARHVSVLDVLDGRTTRRLAVGPDPAGLACAGPHALAVAERGAGTVSLYDPRSGRRRRRVAVGGWPRAIVARGRRAYVADEQTGRLGAFGI